MTQTKVERTLETLVDFADLHKQSLNKMVESIDALTVQVTQFNAGMRELKDLSRQILMAIEADREVAKIQAQNVQQMVALSAQQQMTINTLIAKIAA